MGLGLGLTRPAQAGEIAGSYLASRAATGDRAPPHAPHPLPALLRSSFASQKLLGELLLNGNEIGRSGATKLIQYARVRVRGRSRCRWVTLPLGLVRVRLRCRCRWLGLGLGCNEIGRVDRPR